MKVIKGLKQIWKKSERPEAIRKVEQLNKLGGELKQPKRFLSVLASTEVSFEVLNKV